MEMATIQLPKPLFDRLARMAEMANRPVAEYIAQSLDVTVPLDAPPNVQAMLANMINLSDRALWDATQPSLQPMDDNRLRQLNHLTGERDLTAIEYVELNKLMDAYYSSVLQRARAFAILKLRGFTIPENQKLPLEFERA
jgi:hypothetical protein